MLWMSRLTGCWPSPAQSFLASGLVEIYDELVCSLLDMYVVRGGAYSLTREGVGLSVLGSTMVAPLGILFRVYYCWSSPAQSFLIPSPKGLMAIFYCLKTLDTESVVK
jgi:hypothetical protein